MSQWATPRSKIRDPRPKTTLHARKTSWVLKADIEGQWKCLPDSINYPVLMKGSKVYENAALKEVLEFVKQKGDFVNAQHEWSGKPYQTIPVVKAKVDAGVLADGATDFILKTKQGKVVVAEACSYGGGGNGWPAKKVSQDAVADHRQKQIERAAELAKIITGAYPDFSLVVVDGDDHAEAAKFLKSKLKNCEVLEFSYCPEDDKESVATELTARSETIVQLTEVVANLEARLEAIADHEGRLAALEMNQPEPIMVLQDKDGDYVPMEDRDWDAVQSAIQETVGTVQKIFVNGLKISNERQFSLVTPDRDGRIVITTV